MITFALVEESSCMGPWPMPAPRSRDRPRVGGRRCSPEATDDEWQRRIAKRQAFIAVVKADRNYIQCIQAAARAGTRVPAPPEATDRSISKRSWDLAVALRRAGIRDELLRS